MKLTKEQINLIQKGRSEGKTQMYLAKEFNVCLATIQYHTDLKQKENRKEHSRNYFKGLSKEKKKEMYESHKEYWKAYTKNRYKTDEEYRLRMLEYQKAYKKRKENV